MFNIGESGLYKDQAEVMYKSLKHFTHDDDQIITLGASAGVGKTFTVRNIIKCATANGITLSAGAFTGRACQQLNTSGIDANTLHSILLNPVIDDAGNLLRWEDKPEKDIKEYIQDGIILDEASFIPLDMYLKFMDLGVKIMNCGDFMQLPSISSDSSGESIEFNAMLDTTDKVITLTKNRRFDEQSGIGRMATHLRNHNTIPRITADDISYVTKNTVYGEMFHRAHQYDIVVCGYNNTRHTLNALIRNARGFYSDIPEVGEQIMCMRNTVINNSKINNGEIYTIEWVTEKGDYSSFNILSECGKYRHKVDIMNAKWFNESAPNRERKVPFCDFGFGYTSTVHKAQGSTFGRVLMIDDDVSKFVDRQKWRYTGTTRAADHLTIAV